MTKRQLIDEIREFNPTAQPGFLSQFQEDALRQYLEHLREARAKRVQVNTWVGRTAGLKKVS